MYQLKLREDMPPGFKDNWRFPELPAVFNFLKPLDGKKYERMIQFVNEMKGFNDFYQKYLEQNNLSPGDHPEMAEGIFIFREEWVGVHDSMGHSPECIFGRLESVASTESKKLKPK